MGNRWTKNHDNHYARSLAFLVVLSTQGQNENAVFAVRLLIHGKGRELGDLVYVTTLHVSGARRLLCCSSGQGTRLHTCTPGTVSTHCKYQSVVCSVCADMQYCIYNTICMYSPTKVVQIEQGAVI